MARAMKSKINIHTFAYHCKMTKQNYIEKKNRTKYKKHIHTYFDSTFPVYLSTLEYKAYFDSFFLFGGSSAISICVNN